MLERLITRTKKDQDGDITALCNTGQVWSPRVKLLAINDIESNAYKYYTLDGSKRTYVKVVNGPNGKYLRTDSDNTSRNNLDDLPDC